MKTLTWAAALVSLATALQPAIAAESFSTQQKDEIGAIVREYLLAHPETLMEMQQALEKKQSEDRMAQAKVAVDANKELIFNAPYDLSVGNPQGKVTVVEFFDYNCGYCRRAMKDMDAIVKSNSDVRFVLKEFPILGPDSVAAHKVSNAFRTLAPEKYGEFHRELLGGDHADEARAIEVAKKLGVSEKDLRAQMDKSDFDAKVQDAYKLATELGISGTPSYVIGNEAIFGAVGADALSQKIANVGQCGKTVC
jgi:protein-disulfide isomerase